MIKDMTRVTNNVLGTPYEVLLGTKSQIGISEENMGECRSYSKKILVSTEQDDCTEEELMVRTQEIVAHEIFHAYANEAGLDLTPDTEEMVANFFMKTWRKMNNSILEICDESGFLDK